MRQYSGHRLDTDAGHRARHHPEPIGDNDELRAEVAVLTRAFFARLLEKGDLGRR